MNESDMSIFINKRGKLSNDDISKMLLATVLDHIIDQIFLLNRGRICHQKHISMIPKEELFIEDPIFDHDTGQPYDVAFKERKVRKMADSSTRYAQFCASQKDELLEYHTFQISRIKLNANVEKRKKNESLFAQEKSNFTKMNLLKETLLTETRDSQQEIQNLCEVLSDINDENQIILFRDMLRCRYMKEWEKSRSEQNLLSCKKKERTIQTVIDNYKTEIEKETRIDTEIELFLMEDQEMMEYQIEEWMEKFDRDTENRNLEIQKLKEKREDQALDHRDMLEMFEDHKIEIEDYLEFKDKARREAEYLILLDSMATRIQAWWRGLLVRCKLGPFNPKKGKKGKKGKDKKSNKKK